MSSAARRLPDSALVREATAMARAAVSPSVFNHSLRTFLLGSAWAARRQLAFDDEALLLAALFHDLGFDRSAVAGLLQVGAWMDLTFLRRWPVRGEARSIARAWPRLGIDLAFPRLLVRSIGSVGACTGLLFPRRRS